MHAGIQIQIKQVPKYKGLNFQCLHRNTIFLITDVRELNYEVILFAQMRHRAISLLLFRRVLSDHNYSFV